MAFPCPNITHTLIILYKEIFIFVGISNTFGTVFYNHTFPAILFLSIQMFPKPSFGCSCNTNLHIFIVTMILPNTSYERWDYIRRLPFVIKIFNFHRNMTKASNLAVFHVYIKLNVLIQLDCDVVISSCIILIIILV